MKNNANKIKNELPEMPALMTHREDLNQLLANGSDDVILLTISGDSEDVNIFNGDLIIVDKSKTPKTGDIVIRFADGEFSIVRHIADKRRGLRLVSAMPETVESDGEIYGVVTFIIKPLEVLG